MAPIDFGTQRRRAKTLAIIEGVGSVPIGLEAWSLYSSGRIYLATVWAAMAVIWTGLSIISVLTMRRAAAGEQLFGSPGTQGSPQQ